MTTIQDFTKAKLVAYSQPAEEFKDQFTSIKDLVAYCARVSNPSNQLNTETSDKLINYLLKHKHFSPFEMASITLEIETPRDIARQLLRHRSFTFQEFCVTGDTLITLELPKPASNGKRSSYKRTIEHLYNLQNKGKMPSCIRVYDEESKTFVNSSIKEVFQTGIKPVFKITLANGKSISSTKDHKFFTPDGFKTMQDIIGLVHVGNTAAISNKAVIACNGVLAYQDKDWLLSTKEKSIINKGGLQFIADEAGVTTHTIRKWLKKYSLQFTKKEVSLYSPIWNKGLSGYSLPKHSMETIDKMRSSAKRGEESNLWKGGVTRSERLKVSDWCNANRSEFLKSAEYNCKRCASTTNLELHHKLTVSEYPEFAYDKSNIEVLCKKCHRDHHSLNGDLKTWSDKSSGNRLTIEWSEVVSVEYVGEVMTYDLEVDHISHNYVGNGILTHNSQRYADPTKDLKFITRDARLQDPKNRQNSVLTEDKELIEMWDEIQTDLLIQVKKAYTWAVTNGIAKEQARAVLPEGLTMSRLYVQGTIRSFIHYIDVRDDDGVQLEHRVLAQMVSEAICKIFNVKISKD